MVYYDDFDFLDDMERLEEAVGEPYDYPPYDFNDELDPERCVNHAIWFGFMKYLKGV